MAETSNHGGPLGISTDVADIQVIQVTEETREIGNSRQLGGAGVRGFTGIAVGVECAAAVRVDKLGGKIQTGKWLRSRRGADL